MPKISLFHGISQILHNGLGVVFWIYKIFKSHHWLKISLFIPHLNFLKWVVNKIKDNFKSLSLYLNGFGWLSLLAFQVPTSSKVGIVLHFYKLDSSYRMMSFFLIWLIMPCFSGEEVHMLNVYRRRPDRLTATKKRSENLILA